MSHEIRTPMNGIIGMQALALSADRKDTCNYIEKAQSSAKSLMGILNDILDISTIEAGHFEIRSETFRLRAFIEEALQLVRGSAEDKGLQLRCSIAGTTPDSLIGDPLRIRQVLLNVLGNAIKFTKRGGVELHIDHSRGDGRERQLQFAVLDTGIGIPAEKQGVIFDSFHQMDSSTTRQYGGTGLGLAISKRLVELMGGSMRVQSALGSGSTFHFTIACQATHARAEERSTAAQDSSGPRRPLQILVVDDNPVNQLIARKVLERRGHVVQLAEDGLAALRIVLEDEPPDAIVMDIQMPKMDGLQATFEIRRLKDARRSAIPILAVTAFAQNADRERCLAAGIDGYMTKPFNAAGLCAEIERLAGLGE
jgi:CheY-like chemotaxis protein